MTYILSYDNPLRARVVYDDVDEIPIDPSVTPELTTADDIRLAFNVPYSSDYKWLINCVSVEKEDDAIVLKYHGYSYIYKHDEERENDFTIRIDDKYITINFDKFHKYYHWSTHEYDTSISSNNVTVKIAAKWLAADQLPPMPNMFKDIVDDSPCCAIHVGKNLYLAMCQIYNNKELLARLKISTPNHIKID
jgi:hypothetical protein